MCGGSLLVLCVVDACGKWGYAPPFLLNDVSVAMRVCSFAVLLAFSSRTVCSQRAGTNLILLCAFSLLTLRFTVASCIFCFPLPRGLRAVGRQVTKFKVGDQALLAVWWTRVASVSPILFSSLSLYSILPGLFFLLSTIVPYRFSFPSNSSWQKK